MEKRLPVFKYYPKKPPKTEEKAAVGPGYLKDLEASYRNKSLSTSTPKYPFPKSKIVRKAEELANSNKYVPGVGHYKDKEKAFTSYILEKKSRMPFISKSKDIRFTESFMLAKTWVPGPGSYDASPTSSKSKK